MMNFNLPNDVIFILNTINNNGEKAYIVGGCLRDLLLGITPNDYDITTSATPEEIIDIFSNYPCFDYGRKHGTISLLLNDTIYEITTFRIEEDYNDFRHPSNVSFTNDVALDLQRRDLTINALAYNPNEGIIDVVNGINDINNRVIQTVYDPYKRFNEDALRILRTLRFKAQLNFKIAPKTSIALHDCKDLLVNISKERIFTELTKTLMADYPENVLLDYYDIYQTIIPQLAEIPKYSYQRAIKALSKSEKNLLIRLTIFLHYLPECHSILTSLHCDNKTINTVTTLTNHYYDFIQLDEVSIKWVLNDVGLDNLKLLLAIQKADRLINEYMFEKYLTIISDIIDNNKCYSLSQLAIKGSHIKELGYQNKKIGQVLNFILKKVINNQLTNDLKEITEYIIKHQKQ